MGSDLCLLWRLETARGSWEELAGPARRQGREGRGEPRRADCGKAEDDREGNGNLEGVRLGQAPGSLLHGPEGNAAGRGGALGSEQRARSGAAAAKPG